MASKRWHESFPSLPSMIGYHQRLATSGLVCCGLKPRCYRFDKTWFSLLRRIDSGGCALKSRPMSGTTSEARNYSVIMYVSVSVHTDVGQ